MNGLIRLGVAAFVIGTLIVIPHGSSAHDRSQHAKATFAGGCFWCMESPFEEQEGVIEAVSGYTGGPEVNPTYEEVASGQTGHLESIQIIYDSDKISYETLLEIFWRQIDPTDAGGSFADRGPHYCSAIFYHDLQQKTQALASKNKARSEEHTSELQSH